MLVFIDAVSDLGEELLIVFPSGLLLGFGEGDDLVALAFGHCGCCMYEVEQLTGLYVLLEVRDDSYTCAGR